MNLQKLIAFDKYLTSGYQVNINLTQLSILIGLLNGAKDANEIALMLDRSMDNTLSHMTLLKLHNSQNPKAIGFIHSPNGDEKFHLTREGRAWMENLLSA